ncbi:MAG: helix-turn-helix transcriptional regulator [Treponema sp.]|nr:helix-turn-helix transcriptional regulator [Candidatus Treponema equifaecale]
MKEILKYLRQLNNLSQQEIAEKIGITRQSYIKYENGTVIPNDRTVHHLAAIYKVSELFIRQNRIPVPEEKAEPATEKFYELNEEKNLVKAAEPEMVMEFKAPSQERKIYEGIFDGNAVRILSEHNFTRGQKIHLWVEDEKEQEEAREKAWEILQSFRGSLPADFDYKKELMEALDEKYNSIG